MTAASQPILDAIEGILGLACGGVRAQQIAETASAMMAGTGTEDPAAYARRLQHDAVERERLAEALRVPETYFLRDPQQLQAVSEHVLLPVARQGRRRLRIWSAGCASGEEAYSLAITLEVAGLAGRADILATDRSALALETAVAGRYRPWSLRGLDDGDRLRHFSSGGADGEVSVVDRLRGHVTFERHDLIADPYPAGFDLIVCRNVLLYLTPERGREVVDRLAGALAPGGWLVLGTADPHLQAATVLEQVRTPAGALYRRALPQQPPAAPLIAATVQQRTPGPSACHRTGRRRSAVTDGQVRRARLPEVVADSTTSEELVEPPTTIDGCRDALDRRPLDAGIHVTHARLLLDAGRPEEALSAARRALFLDPGHAAALFVVGSARLALKDPAGAARAFRKAADALEASPDDGVATRSDPEDAYLLEIARAGEQRSSRSSR